MKSGEEGTRRKERKEGGIFGMKMKDVDLEGNAEKEEKREKTKCVGMEKRKRWREMKGESVEEDW